MFGFKLHGFLKFCVVQRVLEGPWVVISKVISPLIWV